MKTTGLILAVAVALASGCAKTDWIDRTLVTVDVTGTWYGNFMETGGAYVAPTDVTLELKQEGSRVTGFVRTLPVGTFVRTGVGSIEGTVAGDVFRFSQTMGSLEGEMRVSGDEMNGQVSIYTLGTISLRRVDSPSRPGPPTR